MISFIVPAYNEERWIAPCLESVRAAMEKTDTSWEVIVVDDASTDSTAQIAERMGARVIRVARRQVSAVRNAGARAAQGQQLFFVDADTCANERAIGAALDALRAGAVGGGCVFKFDRPLPLWGRILYPIGAAVGRRIRLVGGCFLFCTRVAYEAAGGFSERLYSGEDMAFIQALKRVGRFVVPAPTVITSGRKFDVVGLGKAIFLLVKIAVGGRHLESRDRLDIIYGKGAAESREPRRD